MFSRESLTSAISSSCGLYGIPCSFTSKTSRPPTKPHHPKTQDPESPRPISCLPCMCTLSTGADIVASTQASKEASSKQASERASEQASEQASKQEERGRGEGEGESPSPPRNSTTKNISSASKNIRPPVGPQQTLKNYQAPCWTSDLP